MQLMRSGVNQTGLQALCDFMPLEAALMVEVGSFAGESTRIFAESGKFRRIYAVDNWRYLPAQRPEERFDEVAKEFDGIIVKLQSESTVRARDFTHQVDFVYVDASHSYDNVLADIRAWKKHVKHGGYIAGHDYNWQFPGVLRAVFEQFGKPFRVFEDSSWLVQLK